MYPHVVSTLLRWVLTTKHSAGITTPPEEVTPRYTIDENGVLIYEYDPEYMVKKYEVFDLRIIHR